MEFQIGDIMVGEITGIQPYGAFLRFPNEECGLIHISEISSFFVRNITDYVNIGQHVRVKIIDIYEEKGMYRLSLKQVETRMRQNIRTPKASPRKKRIKVPLDKQDFTPLGENLDRWILEELEKIGVKQND